MGKIYIPYDLTETTVFVYDNKESHSVEIVDQGIVGK